MIREFDRSVINMGLGHGSEFLGVCLILVRAEKSILRVRR